MSVLIAVGVVVVYRRNRDRSYREAPPGQVPVPGADRSVELGATIPVVPQPTPPPGLAPAVVGTLVSRNATTAAVTATLVDLAVRGYLVVQRVGPGHHGRLLRAAPPHGLLPHELLVYATLFPGLAPVFIPSARNKLSAPVRRCLGREVVQLGFFARSPWNQRLCWWAVAFVAMLALGLLPQIDPHLIVLTGLPLLTLSIGAFAIGLKGAPRTADGSAAYAQAIGFREYLRTIDPDQIPWEDGVDVFVRYLPYAVALGCTDHWTEVFVQLAAHGQYQVPWAWYVDRSGLAFAGGEGLGSAVTAVVSGLSSIAEIPVFHHYPI